jgi:murein L,D-transpeptidase YcbB/YkuD
MTDGKYKRFYFAAVTACIVLFITAISFPLNAQVKATRITEKLNNAAAVKKFHTLAGAHAYWFADAGNAFILRRSLLTLVDTCRMFGLNPAKYHQQFLRMYIMPGKADSAVLHTIDDVFTDAAIGVCRDIYAGNITGYLSYDEITPKYADSTLNYIIRSLAAVKNGSMLRALVDTLEPPYEQYRTLKADLALAYKYQAADKIKKITSALNYLRWITHFRFRKFILVNIPSATLDFYNGDSVLTMKVVVGKPSTKTPRFAAYCTQVVLYPYWNVPASIALHELLPKFKKSPALVDGMNMQVIDGNGRVVNHHNINWSAYSASNFPYQLRQSTGCDNSLGVIKFNLTDPFNVYMHDTNYKLAFLLASRYLSHGCIRVEKPMELANSILAQPVDSNFVNACLKDQKPVELQLPEPVPVLVLYLITNPDHNIDAPFYKDIYKMF